MVRSADVVGESRQSRVTRNERDVRLCERSVFVLCEKRSARLRAFSRVFGISQSNSLTSSAVTSCMILLVQFIVAKE
jgi:hypothetical protein